MSTNNKNSIMKEYDLSSLGFLPENPIPRLNDLCPEWERFIACLPLYNKAHSTREMVELLPELILPESLTDNQYKRLYSMLTIISNSYVFNTEPLVSTLPSKISVPLWRVSTYLGINPVLTHGSVDLFNWEYKNENEPFELDNLLSQSLMTGAQDEEWFYLIMVAIEGVGGSVISDYLDIVIGLRDGTIDQEVILDKLISIKDEIRKMCAIIQRIYEKCNPDYFYGTLRIYLSGTEKIPDGLSYVGVTGCENKKYCGGSAAQSTLFPVLDAAFGIKHDDEYFVRIRDYMPMKHRNFIEFVSRHNLYDLVNTVPDCQEHLDQCVSLLKSFRKLHYNLVRDYIIVPSRGGASKGTGGTALNDFLVKSIRDTKH